MERRIVQGARVACSFHEPSAVSSWGQPLPSVTGLLGTPAFAQQPATTPSLDTA